MPASPTTAFDPAVARTRDPRPLRGGRRRGHRGGRLHRGEQGGDGQDDGGHGRQAHRRRRPGFRHHDDRPPPGRHRHGRGRAFTSAATSSSAGSPRASSSSSSRRSRPCVRSWRTHRARPARRERSEMDRRAALALLLASALALAVMRPAHAGQAPAPRRTPTSRSATATGSMPPSSSPTRSRSPIPSTIDCWRDPAGRLAAGQLQPPLSRPGAGARHGILARQPDLAVVSIGSNSVTFIDTATNAVKHVTYVGRSPPPPRGLLHPRRQGGLGDRAR